MGDMGSRDSMVRLLTGTYAQTRQGCSVASSFIILKVVDCIMLLWLLVDVKGEGLFQFEVKHGESMRSNSLQYIAKFHITKLNAEQSSVVHFYPP